MSILVVDDERELALIFGRWLTALGYRHVKTAFDGDEALELLKTEHFDLLVSDIHMPGIDGVNLVRRMGELGLAIPSIIFLSGFGIVDKKEMYALGVEAFLSKPLHMEELKAAVDKALADRGTLWDTPMDPTPRQTMVVKIKELAGSAEPQGPQPGAQMGVQKGLRLGRGGFTAPFSGSLSVGKVSFRCIIEAEKGVVSGEGWVRWRSKTDSTAGVEFAFLDATCRDWTIAKIAELQPRSFIPE